MVSMSDSCFHSHSLSTNSQLVYVHDQMWEKFYSLCFVRLALSIYSLHISKIGRRNGLQHLTQKRLLDCNLITTNVFEFMEAKVLKWRSRVSSTIDTCYIFLIKALTWTARNVFWCFISLLLQSVRQILLTVLLYYHMLVEWPAPLGTLIPVHILPLPHVFYDS